MTDRYVDLALGSGLNDGTSWTDAWQGTGGFLSACTNAAAGDRVFVKGQVTENVTRDFLIANGIIGNPVVFLGCKSATTATPPTQSDLIPGYATGASVFAYDDADAPDLTQTGSSNSIKIRGFAYFYGIKFRSGTAIYIYESTSTKSGGRFAEECLFESNVSNGFSARDMEIGAGASGPDDGHVEFYNCRLRIGDSDDQVVLEGSCSFVGCVFDSDSTLPAGGLIHLAAAVGFVEFVGCDFSAVTNIVDITNATSVAQFRGCVFASSYTLANGTPSYPFRLSNYGSAADPSPAKGAGESIQNYDYKSNHGDIILETTAVRTNGADDGADGGFSWAMTPTIDKTRDEYWALTSEWISSWVAGDGTSKTATVYVANSGGADYNDDDIWLEVWYPPEDGLAQLDFKDTRMGLLGTPTAVTDDTDSVWGTGGNNPQKLQATIAPDYEGLVTARVCFAKHFSASPETLYVDPKLDVS